MLAFAERVAGSGLSQWLVGIPNIVQIMQSIHIISIGIVLISVAMIDLRVLGWRGTSATVAETNRQFGGWLWLAIGLLAFSGLTLVLTEPVRSLVTTSFWVKMALLAIGIITALAFQASLRRRAAFWDTAHSRSGIKLFGILTLVLWLAIVVLGRFIAYDEQMLGRFSISPTV